jgi:hypothetical protein
LSAAGFEVTRRSVPRPFMRRLDRLGGTERILIETLHELEDKGVDIKSPPSR